MNNNRHKLVMLVILAILIFTGCQTQEKSVHTVEGKKVETITVQEQTKPITLDYLGHVEAKEQKKIAFSNGGTILKMEKEVGDEVQKGELIATLDKEMIESDTQIALNQYNRAKNAVLEAKGMLNFAEDNYLKNKTLYEQGAIAKVTYDEAKLNYETTQSKYYQAQNSLSTARNQYEKVLTSVENHNVYSEISGTVVTIMSDEGEKVPPMQPFMTIASHDKEIITSVVREDVEQITIGENVTVMYEGEAYDATVTQIARQADPMTKTYPVTIVLNQEAKNMIDQSIVNVKFSIGEEQGIWIPLDTVVVDIENFVFVNNNNKADKIKIELLATDGESVKVNGIKSGDELITKGMSSLRDDDTIEIIN